MNDNEEIKSPRAVNFLKNLFDWIREVIQTADLSIVLLILVVLPLIVPLVPAWVTMKNLETQMGFGHEVSVLGGITVEFLGYAGALLSLKSITDRVKNKTSKNNWAVAVNIGAYLFYLVAVISINVILDWKAGKDWSYVWVIALLCLLSVPSGMLSATRIIDREEKTEEVFGEAKRQEREDRLRQEVNEREMEILRLKEKSKTERQAIRRGLVPTSLQQDFNIEVSTSTPTSNSASIPSTGGGKLKLNEAVKKFIEVKVKQENRFPPMPEIRNTVGGSDGSVFYAMMEFLVEEEEYLVGHGIVSQEKVNKAKVSLQKKNRK